MARILVIEDEPVIRAITRRILVEAGHEVVETATARTGIEALRSVRVDLVLADIGLQGEDGVTAMARIRGSHPGLPLIAVSGCHRDDVSSQLEAAGLRTAVSWIAKPFAHDALLAAVRSALAR
jgi:CheY-like chemotaxis protein